MSVRRHPVLIVATLILLLALVVVAVSGVVVWRAAHHDDASEVDHADAILVLGAAQYNGTPSPVLRGRLQHAIVLWNQQRADLVITLGAKQPGDRSTEAEAGRDYLLSQGVPSEAVVALSIGNTTWESMRAAAQFLRRRGMDSAFLVSDPWHNARLKRMAGDLGIHGYASATWTSAARSERTRSEGYVRETLAYLYYRVFGA